MHGDISDQFFIAEIRPNFDVQENAKLEKSDIAPMNCAFCEDNCTEIWNHLNSRKILHFFFENYQSMTRTIITSIYDREKFFSVKNSAIFISNKLLRNFFQL